MAVVQCPMSKIVGKICPDHPDAGGERYAFASGNSICIHCNVLRVQRWKAADPVYQSRVAALRKSESYKKKFNAYRRDLRRRKKLAIKVQEHGAKNEVQS